MMMIITIILAIGGISLISVAALALGINLMWRNEGETYLIFLPVILAGCILIGAAFSINSKQTNNVGYDKGYEAGQIDAAQGIQKYHLTTRPKVWEKKKEE